MDINDLLRGELYTQVTWSADIQLGQKSAIQWGNADDI